jgi:hypothetical protein
MNYARRSKQILMKLTVKDESKLTDERGEGETSDLHYEVYVSK